MKQLLFSASASMYLCVIWARSRIFYYKTRLRQQASPGDQWYAEFADPAVKNISHYTHRGCRERISNQPTPKLHITGQVSILPTNTHTALTRTTNDQGAEVARIDRLDSLESPLSSRGGGPCIGTRALPRIRAAQPKAYASSCLGARLRASRPPPCGVSAALLCRRVHTCRSPVSLARGCARALTCSSP